eukprot:6207271-Pleurochrysis_carterae.AAC.1
MACHLELIRATQPCNTDQPKSRQRDGSGKRVEYAFKTRLVAWAAAQPLKPREMRDTPPVPHS